MNDKDAWPPWTSLGMSAGPAGPSVDLVLRTPAEVLVVIGPVREGRPPTRRVHDFETFFARSAARL